jgi:AcrR family transcriptional regulator
MVKRAASREETRRRIVEATMQLHIEKGVLNTTVADIARRADVAVGTVYRHFPSIDDLVDACGRAVWDLVGPPPAGLLSGVEGVRERVSCLVDAYCETYGRMQRLGVDQAAFRAEAAKSPPLAAWFAVWEERHASLVREALGARASAGTLAVLQMLTRWDAWRTLTSAGMPDAEAARALRDLAFSWTEGQDREGGAIE